VTEEQEMASTEQSAHHAQVGCCEVPVPMVYAGRLYQSPTNKNQLWINFGWNTEDNQAYPAYEEALAPHLSGTQYEALITGLKSLIDRVGTPCYSGAMQTLSSGLLGLFTCGISCILANSATEDFDALVEQSIKLSSLEAQISRQTCQVSFKHVSNVNQRDGKRWIDADGFELDKGTRFASINGLGEVSSKRAGGPPMGYNIVLLIGEELEWPLRRPQTAGEEGVTKDRMKKVAEVPVIRGATELPGTVTQGAPTAEGSGVLSHRTGEKFLLSAPPPRKKHAQADDDNADDPEEEPEAPAAASKQQEQQTLPVSDATSGLSGRPVESPSSRMKLLCPEDRAASCDFSVTQ